MNGVIGNDNICAQIRNHSLDYFFGHFVPTIANVIFVLSTFLDVGLEVWSKNTMTIKIVHSFKQMNEKVYKKEQK